MNINPEIAATPPLTSTDLKREISAFEPNTEIVILKSSQDLPAHHLAFLDLQQNALEPNVFYEYWFVKNSLDYLSNLPTATFVLIYFQETPGNGGRRLIGFFPLVSNRLKSWLPLSRFHLWHHPYCFLHTPLVHRQFADKAFSALSDYAAAQTSYLIFDDIRVDGPFFQSLLESLDGHSATWSFLELHTRACWSKETDQEAAASFSGKHAKEIRRLRNRLSEIGKLTLEISHGGNFSANLIDEFLALEASGWKGQAGTALAGESANADFFRQSVTAAAQSEKVEFSALRLDGRPIAMKCTFFHGSESCEPGGFAFKIAFDEEFARYSPGVLLELEYRKSIKGTATFMSIDSCAQADHPMINRIWNGRRTIGTVAISTGGFWSKFCLQLLPLFRFIRKVSFHGVLCNEYERTDSRS